METFGKEVLSTPDRVLGIVDAMVEVLEASSEVSFYGLVYESLPGRSEFIVVCYEGKLLSVTNIGFDSSFRLLAEAKYIGIKNAADIASDLEEINQVEAFLELIDPATEEKDEEWVALCDWKTQELEIPVKHLDTYGMTGVSEWIDPSENN